MAGSEYHRGEILITWIEGAGLPFDKMASTDDLLIWLESELILRLDEWPDPFDLCASAACSHICTQ